MNYFVGQTNKENAVAYCHYPEHIGYLSPKLIKIHDCLQKNCKYLHKYDHPYWDRKRMIKSEKKMRKLLEGGDVEKIADYIAGLIGG